MLVDIKSRIDEVRIKELIGYSVFPDPVQLEKAINTFRNDKELELVGYESEGEIIGIIGFTMDHNGILEIKHIAVDPQERGKGYGRGQILELISYKKPAEISAETDDEAVEFYRNIGFEVISLGEKYPGVERFKCTYNTKLDD